jgi:hypothetical protein
MSPQESQTRTDQSSTTPRFGLSLTQVVGSAVAAAAAAFGASYLGVAGTIIGAAVGSVIATVASAMYTTSVHRTRQVVRTTVTQWTGTTATAPVVDPNAPPIQPARRRPPWSRVALAAAAVLAVALGGITAVETLAGRPLAGVVGGSSASGTSLGNVDGSGGSTTRRPRTAAPAAPPAVSGTPSATPAPAPTTTSGSTGPTGTPTSSPSTQPTTAPSAGTSPDPTPTPTAGATPGANPTGG